MGFIPIVLVESLLVSWLAGVQYMRALGAVLIANLASTLVGVPLTWIVLVIVQIVTGGGVDRGVGFHAVTWQAPWLIPHDDHLHWMIPAAGLTLIVPFFLVSAWSESLIVRAMWRTDDRRKIRMAVWSANAISYTLLAGWWGWLLAGGLVY